VKGRTKYETAKIHEALWEFKISVSKILTGSRSLRKQQEIIKTIIERLKKS